MSKVTNIILIAPTCCNKSVINLINNKISEIDGEKQHKNILLQVDQHAGGRKTLEADVYMGAFDYFDIAQFKQWFNSTKFSEGPLQLLVQEQDEDIFTEVQTN